MRPTLKTDAETRLRIDVDRRIVWGALAACAGLVAQWSSAAPIDTTWIVSGAPLSAATLSKNLDDLQSQITALQEKRVATDPVSGKSVAVAGSLCGVTVTAYNGGQVGGYDNAKALCEAVAGCSSLARMCTGAEMATWSSTGAAFPDNVSAWVSTGLSTTYGASSANLQRDCRGWKVGTGAEYSATWLRSPTTQAGGIPDWATCDTSHPIACCD